MEVSTSKIIGKYELVSKIGRGSTADVWSAIHKDTKEKVALKIYAKVQHLDEVATIMFEQEFKKSQQFSHPNILKAIDYFIFYKMLFHFHTYPQFHQPTLQSFWKLHKQQSIIWRQY